MCATTPDSKRLLNEALKIFSDIYLRDLSHFRRQEPSILPLLLTPLRTWQVTVIIWSSLPPNHPALHNTQASLWSQAAALRSWEGPPKTSHLSSDGTVTALYYKPLQWTHRRCSAPGGADVCAPRFPGWQHSRQVVAPPQCRGGFNLEGSSLRWVFSSVSILQSNCRKSHCFFFNMKAVIFYFTAHSTVKCSRWKRLTVTADSQKEREAAEPNRLREFSQQVRLRWDAQAKAVGLRHSTDVCSHQCSGWPSNI